MNVYDELRRREVVANFLEMPYDWQKEMNDIVDLAAEICGTEVALVTILDGDTQWIKASKGIKVESTPQEISFCTHTIAQNQVMVVPDATLDARFVDNPLVTNDPNVRFYAGARLDTHEGHPIGTLCVISTETNVLTEKQQIMLQKLSRQVMNILELERSRNLLQHQYDDLEKQKENIQSSENKLLSFFHSSSHCHILIDRNEKVLFYNKAVQSVIEKVHGKAILEGEDIYNYISKSFLKRFASLFHNAMQGTSSEEVIFIQYPEEGIWWKCFFEPALDSAGHLIGVSFTAEDVTHSKVQHDQLMNNYKALEHINHIQSHEYRRPVASILGMMNLIRSEKYQASKEYLLMLERAVLELDDKIRFIVRLTEDGTGLNAVA